MIADWVQGHAPYFVKFTNKLIERDWSLITKKAMTDNARHGEWLAEMERLNIPLHSTFYCFIKLLVNHAFTSFKPFHLFRISQAYIYNSALSCIIRVRKISRLRSLRDGCFNCCRSMLSAHTLSILFFYPIVINPDTERLHAILFSIESASIFRRNIRRENVHRHSPFAKKVYKTPCKLERTMI